MSGGRPQRGREWSRAAIALGVFAAIQTFVFFARRDRFSVLFWWTSESWLLVALLWCKDLALAAAAFLASRGIDPGGDAPDTAIARVVPAGRGGS